MTAVAHVCSEGAEPVPGEHKRVGAQHSDPVRTGILLKGGAGLAVHSTNPALQRMCTSRVQVTCYTCCANSLQPMPSVSLKASHTAAELLLKISLLPHVSRRRGA